MRETMTKLYDVRELYGLDVYFLLMVSAMTGMYLSGCTRGARVCTLTGFYSRIPTPNGYDERYY